MRITKNFSLSLAIVATTLGLLAALAPLAGRAQSDPVPAIEGPAVSVETVVSGLEHPWGMAFLPNDAGILITERPGTLRVWTKENGLSAPISGVPKVHAQGQGGLLDVALAPDFFRSRRVYLAYAERRDKQHSATTVGFGVLSSDLTRLDAFRPIFRQEPALSTGQHYGVRMAFDPGGRDLYIALGENNQPPTAQQLDHLQGKVVRIRPDGMVPRDNPFRSQRGARGEIWSYGHRNPQGLAWNPWTNELWVAEHGPQGGDELNVIQAGANYGWPLRTEGLGYDGKPVPNASATPLEGFTEPLHYWSVSPAISGMAFYDRQEVPGWQYSLFVGALKEQALIRLQFDEEDGYLVGEERLLEDLQQRIRDVRIGPDGAVYVLTDDQNGQLLRIQAKP
ncbi:PQQ-dependent sugar dehydrogenase [Alcaligenes sp. SJTW-7]|jgi:glucose/arabinose dehydrogenase|uniref:PQQ-dependent sugar dehydrogenase n=1 Tax=Alcaligenes sp. SJTW-7 TaxID=3078429 RepID=UPI0039ED7A79